MNNVQKRILVVGVAVFSLGLLIVPWASPHAILVRGKRLTMSSDSYMLSLRQTAQVGQQPRADQPLFASSGYCLIFALPQGASIAFGRMWPPLVVVVLGTALGLYLAYGQDRRTPFYGKPPSSS